jgi:methylated-DNA-[protein]-cysteine S-methyltransferase
MKMRRERVREVCHLIREARRRWEAHENAACRRIRERAGSAYEKLTKDEREEVPEELRVWLRYRSEKYFGRGRRGNGMSSKPAKSQKTKPREKPQQHAVASRKVGSAVGPLYLVSSRKGLCGLYFSHRVEPSALPGDNRRDRFLNQTEEELAEYFEGRRREFEVALDARGSGFQRAVWRALAAIPFGQTRGYGELADEIGNPRAVRAVGTANGANPISIIVPCHRVIGKDGSLTGFGGGLEIKRQLLQHEGVLLKSI